MTALDDITIRTRLTPGDLGYLVHMHGQLYGVEYQYGIEFEMYVAAGLIEFYRNFDPAQDRIWLCEHRSRIIGSLLLMHRENNAAQLRYYLVQPEYRGIGLGKKLMDLFMDFLHACHYRSAYLWTTDELHAAAALYRKYGFVLTAEKSSTSFGKPVQEQRYDLTLTATRPYSATQE